jgi:hypothetical protein
MTLEEMRTACGDGTGHVILVIPREPTAEGIRLTPASGPVGCVLNVKEGQTLARFSCRALLRWLDRQERAG